MAGFVAYAIYGQAAQSGQLDAQVAARSQQNAALHQQISDRQREIVEAQTAAWLIEEARKLGYVFPGEKIFVITPPGSSPRAGGGVTAPLPVFSPLPTVSASASPDASGTPGASPAPTPDQFTFPTPTPH